jgi:sedoheptulose-bisphosphatase
MFKALK